MTPSDTLRYACDVCGGPRIPAAPGVSRSGREVSVLKAAQRERQRSTAWRVGAGVVAAFGILSLTVTMLALFAAQASIVGTAIAGGVAAVPFVFAGIAWRKGAAHRKELDRHLDEGWALAASDVMRSASEVGDGDHELTAPELAEALQVDDEEAERVLSRMTIHDFVRARVNDDGEVAYSTGPVSKTRVATPALRVADTEHEAELEQDAELAQKPRERTAR